MDRCLSLATYAFGALAVHTNGALAQDLNCPPSLGNVRVEGNLNVAARCELTGTEIRGNVILYSGGSLIARDVRIRGNLEGRLADFVDMDRSSIDGSVRLEELVGDLTSIERTEIRNDVLLTGSRFSLEILDNDLRAGMQVLGNRGGVLIAGNTIEEDLECAGNAPAPLGVGNRVRGEMEGQCENLLAVAAQGPPPEPPATPAPPSSPQPSTSPSPSPPADPAFTPQPFGGGGGAMGWSVLWLLPLVAWRRLSRR